MKRWVLVGLAVLSLWLGAARCSADAGVRTAAELMAAVNRGSPGDTVIIAPGTYILDSPLLPKAGMTIQGAGADRTIITAPSSWQPDLSRLPQTEDPSAYLVSCRNTPNVTIANLTLTGATLPGAIYAFDCDGLELYGLQIQDFLWSGVRTFKLDHFKVHDNRFIDAGGQERPTGGALYLTQTQNSEFWNNRILKSPGQTRNFYGFKGRKGTNLRFHHNDVQVEFSLEFPHENDRGIEIDHNHFTGPISIPKRGGGPALNGQFSFHIHHNWLQRSYALEWARNAAEVDHNLFDFSTDDDGGNLISSFRREPAQGATRFHDNLIRNPGRGLFWAEGVYNQFSFYNNHVKAATTTRPDGFFGFNPKTNFSTIVIRDNIIENTPDRPRPLMRNRQSYAATIENNRLLHISDSDQFQNPATGAIQGPKQPLLFQAGVEGEYRINGWEVR